jgi:hypothetical protein
VVFKAFHRAPIAILAHVYSSANIRY